MSCNWYDVGCYFGWLIDELKLFFVWLWDMILSGFVFLFESIPPPDFFQTIQSQSISISPSVAFFAEAFRLDFGLQIAVSAYIFRFILRRIPGIG